PKMSAIMCQYCKTDGLTWRQIEGRWRLHYSSGQPHTCRATRDKLAKKIPRNRLEIGFTKEGVKWIMAHPKLPLETPPADYTHPWWSWLDNDIRPQIARTNAAKQEMFQEMVP